MNAVQNAAAADSLDETLRTYFAREHGEQLLRVQVQRVLRKPFSETTFLTAVTQRGIHRLVAKRQLAHPANTALVREPDQASVEFGILQLLHGKFTSIPHCAAPRPIACLPAVNTVVMEHVDGELLVDRFRAVHYLGGRRRLDALKTAYFNCGLWLRCFQKFTGMRPAGPDALRDVLIRCHERLRMIEEAGHRAWSKQLHYQTAELMQRCADNLQGEDLLETGRHGDFGPWNVIVNRGNVTVIDFYGYRFGLVPIDALKMLVYLESVGLEIPNSAQRVQALQRAFLAGLGPAPAFPAALLLLCETMHRIAVIAGVVAAPQRPWLRRVLDRPVVQANVHWLINRANDAALWRRMRRNAV